ncbi:MAG: molybdopterin molybdenumtransferase MoeA [Alphaproteobacteria bacterium CG_4_9_14_3_um_filter_47_13]|nr:MAG: molybdopterin molybdenumtransferase MoeA [Alphaproteobacteria bacterium CG_4_9_14_3_um_filter_47_13]
MITHDEAIEIIRQEGSTHLLGSEIVPLDQIAGRICAETLKSPIANQPFDNSAMDGFALKAEELASAVNDSPVALEVIGRIAAGDIAPTKAPSHGQCYEIMTGAPMPAGCDAVIPIEKAERGKSKVLFRVQAHKDENVRHAGEDFAAGEKVLAPGHVLGSQHILVLATIGIGKIKVICKPKIAVLSTGLEVVDDLNSKLNSGQIYNSTGPYLRSTLSVFGAEVFSCGTVADDAAVFKSKLESMIRNRFDIIVSTGAVSAGSYDFIRQALEEKGAEILFHKVKIRPGKPVLFAKFPDGGPFYIGLPGNPVASAAGLRFFVYPLIRAMQGLLPEQPQYALLKNSYSKKTDFRFFLRAIVSHSDKTTHEVDIMQKQQSFMVSPFITANAWAVAPEGVEMMKTGDVVNVYPLMP